MRPLIIAIGFSPTTVAVSGMLSVASLTRSTTGGGGGGGGSATGSSTFGGGGGAGGLYTSADANGSRAVRVGQSITRGTCVTGRLLPLLVTAATGSSSTAGAATAPSGPDDIMRIVTAARITDSPPTTASFVRSAGLALLFTPRSPMTPAP